jgi:2-iminobutanoate/2-iminopropanoate deaminase
VTRSATPLPTQRLHREDSIMTRQIVTASQAPAAVGPYSHAVIAGGMVFASGQIPLDPATGQIVAGGIAEQTRQVFANLQAVLAAAGTSLDKVVKTTVFLASMDEFAAMNAVYEELMPAPYPARSTVQVARLPRDARVEIEVIALL